MNNPLANRMQNTAMRLAAAVSVAANQWTPHRKTSNRALSLSS
jgi:hypothetical protein